jgi:glycine/D-amino acid oxidase-like deaminating enzyme
MSGRPDVLVIGGGVIGVAAARFLAARGKRVAVVEQGEVG